MTAQMYLPAFLVKQRFAMTANRYELVELRPDGSEGRSMGIAQQKRMALREQVTFFADEARTQPVFSFKARQRLDLGAGYDVTDGAGAPLGYFKKDFGASLLRTTFHVEGAGVRGSGQERNQTTAIVRRFIELPFMSIHFDFTNAEGGPLMHVDRELKLRDRYVVRVPDDRLDFRVAAAMAVGLDALMQR
ncbi:hypothetical protein [Nocardioides bruguierae]|uniref:Uncharacterized protein n=1 Tax=Nocardioides bruguierae TaxID=2945102 RepID=A0A9X2D856_9ACTN|nr:hypothetical protein [Nocardioides bruguierae]MCL8026466.1 hypothetical protein [Nocardioides bruguierae]MCM0619799.1 hypothetical protein [Nocardioides bruguierae]